MTESTKTSSPDLAALAAEACDLWQEHLAGYAGNPDARAAMMQMMEPQRQMLAGLFADYTTMMQNAGHAPQSSPHTPSTDASQTAAGTATSGTASDDIALRMAQLAHRVAQLEKRCLELEKKLARTDVHGQSRVAETSSDGEQD